MRRISSEQGSVTTPIAFGAPPWLSSFAGRFLPLVILGAILAAGAFLRLYKLDGLITFYPDTYAQLQAVDNLLSAQVPLSYHYPPGVAIFMAPIFALLPRTLVTMQAAILIAGVALILVSYLALATTIRDRRAGLIFAASIALTATFIYHSRVGWFDVINTLLIASTILLAPIVVRRGPATVLPYALLVFMAITVRHTNPVILPALFLASLGLESNRLSVRTILSHLRSRAIILTGVAVVALYVLYLGTASEGIGRFANSNSGGVFDFGSYLVRIGQYVRAAILGYEEAWGWEDRIAALVVIALAAIGAKKLWRLRPALLLAAAYLFVIWAPFHALYEIFDNRYSMPAFFFVLMLAALGLSTCIGAFPRLSRPWQRVGLVGLLTLSIAVFLGRQLANDIIFIQEWPEEVSRNREQAYDEIRAALGGLDGGNALLVSSQTLAVEDANPEIGTFDLIRHSGSYGINDDSIERLLTFVRSEQERGVTVYYHFTEYEDVGSRFRRYELGFDAYLSALREENSMRELARDAERAQRLFVLEPASLD